MSIVIFSPYGLASEETGVLALLSNYLQQSSYAVSILKCNGVFSLCDRDAENGWKRGIRSCFSCMYEQGAIARWAGIPVQELSRFLSPEDVADSRRWSLGVSRRSAESVEFDGKLILPMVKKSFIARTGKEVADVSAEEDFETLRRLMLSTVRMLSASKRYFDSADIKLALVAGGEDSLSAGFVTAAKDCGVAVAQFRWDIVSRSVQVTHPAAERAYHCPLVFDDVTTMRTDCRTWPGEIVRIVDELAVFLEISTSQLQLPLAQ